MSNNQTVAALPVLKLSQWFAGGAARQHFIRDLGHAAREVGFFYLTDHGIEPSQQQHILKLAKQFFSLPDAEKQQVQMVNSAQFRGYTRLQGELTGGQPDYREQFDLMREDDLVPTHAIERTWQRIIGPNQWPTAIPSMRDDLLNWQQQLTDLTLVLLEAFARVLEQPADAFQATVADGPYTHMKLIRYPKRTDPTQTQGVGAHKDPPWSCKMNNQALKLKRTQV